MSIDLNAAVSLALRAADPDVKWHLEANGVATDQDRWSVLVGMAEAAACAAKAEWLLVRAARKPHTNGATAMDTRRRAPYVGFFVSYGEWCESEGDADNPSQRYHNINGRGFPLTKQGLEAALLTAEDLTEISGTTQVEVRISWENYLPGDRSAYIAPLFSWKSEG